jgi:hypothetical protein
MVMPTRVTGSNKESNWLLAPAGGNGRGTSYLLLSVASIKRSTSREMRLKGPLSELQKPRARWSRNDSALAYAFGALSRGYQHLSNAFNMDFGFFCALGVRVFPLWVTFPLGHVIQQFLAFFEHP